MREIKIQQHHNTIRDRNSTQRPKTVCNIRKATPDHNTRLQRNATRRHNTIRDRNATQHHHTIRDRNATSQNSMQHPQGNATSQYTTASNATRHHVTRQHATATQRNVPKQYATHISPCHEFCSWTETVSEIPKFCIAEKGEGKKVLNDKQLLLQIRLIRCSYPTRIEQSFCFWRPRGHFILSELEVTDIAFFSSAIGITIGFLRFENDPVDNFFNACNRCIHRLPHERHSPFHKNQWDFCYQKLGRIMVITCVGV